MTKILKMEHAQDPAKVLMEKVGDLSQFELFGNYLLLAVYERPEKTKSGIYLSDQTRGEDAYQGKVGLVLKKGPSAFVSDSQYDFKGQDVNIGDWVSIWVTDGRKLVVNGALCRIVEDQHIRLKVPSPDSVY